MSHPWCSDIERDKAIRAAEDARAVTLPEWRDLPATAALLSAEAGAARERVEELRERVAALEARVAGLNRGGCEVPYDPKYDEAALDRFAEEGAKAWADTPAAPAANADAEANATNQRATAVVVAGRTCWEKSVGVVCDGGSLGRDISLGDVGGGICWADSEMTRLTAERDAALRERDEARESKLKACRERDRHIVALAKVREDWKRRGQTIQCLLHKAAARKARIAELEAAPEAGTVRVKVACGIDKDGNWIVEGSWKYRHLLPWVSLDLTPAQVAEIERQVSGEVKE